MSTQTSDFVIAREFDAPRETLWPCVTEPERMRHWWGPKGAKVVAANMDLRPGGSYHYGLQMPDGKTMWGKFVYREIVAPEKLAFINFFSDEKGGVARHPLAPTWPLELAKPSERPLGVEFSRMRAGSPGLAAPITTPPLASL